MKFSKDGILLISKTVVHVAPNNNTSEVRMMRFFNESLPFTLTVWKGSSILYKVNLSPGDVLTDNDTYMLNENEYIAFQSSAYGTSYLIQGEDIKNDKA